MHNNLIDRMLFAGWPEKVYLRDKEVDEEKDIVKLTKIGK